MENKIVLQKYIADSGYCSRRRAEELIRKGWVTVNGQPAELGQRAGLDDRVEVNGEEIKSANKKIYIKLNKPRGYVCTSRKFENEKNVFDLVKTDERLFVVGRLDKDTSGLVLITNDGELTQELTHPRFEHEKEYKVRVRQDELSQVEADRIVRALSAGVNIGEGDGMARVHRIKYLGNKSFLITLKEGKNRQIRRMFKAAGADIEFLQRERIKNLILGNLKEGKWEYLNEKEIEDLKK